MDYKNPLKYNIMPYGKTPMKKKGSMMYMGHDSAAKMYGSKSAMKIKIYCKICL